MRETTVSIRFFLSDDRGGGTIMGLFWFVLMVGILGLAVDTTDGFPNRNMLQATAEAAALVGVVDLPDSSAAIASTVRYLREDTETGAFDHELKPEDVTVGSWDHAGRTFIPGGVAPDSVMVRLRQAAEDSNAVLGDFLHIFGLTGWGLNVEAVAQRYVPECLRDGLIANRNINISTNNAFVSRTCIHGQRGIEMQGHNYFEPGVNVSMPNLLAMLDLPDGDLDSNPGLRDALREQSFVSRLAPNVGDYMDDLLTKQSYVTPAYVDLTLPIVVKDDAWNLYDMTPGRIYHIQCSPNKRVEIPSGKVLVNVVIVSDCNVAVGAGATMINVILASRASGNGAKPLESATISFAPGANLGLPDNCAPDGGVQVFSNASIHFSSGMAINGLQVIAKGDIELSARDGGINGINAHAGQDIKLASSDMFGLCSGGSPQFFPVWYYRLVS